MVKVNDIVRFLNDIGGGRVTRIEDKMVYVEDEDGFERPALAREVVVVGQAGTKASAYERPIEVKSKLVEPDVPVKRNSPEPAPEPVIETPEGEKLNIILAFEPREIKHLNTTTFYTTLVNDSNYYLYFTYMTRGDQDTEWTTRYHGLVEPNFLLELDEVGHGDLGNMTHIAVQYVAFKASRLHSRIQPWYTDAWTSPSFTNCTASLTTSTLTLPCWLLTSPATTFLQRRCASTAAHLRQP